MRAQGQLANVLKSSVCQTTRCVLHDDAFRRMGCGVKETRRAYRELFYTADVGSAYAGAILYKETLYQSASDGTPFVECMRQRGILPGIKVDEVLSYLRIGRHLKICGLRDWWKLREHKMKRRQKVLNIWPRTWRNTRPKAPLLQNGELL